MRIGQFISGAALEQLGDVIVLVGEEGCILDANGAALECYGYSLDELRSRGFADLCDPEAGTPRVPGCGDDEHSSTFEERHRRAGGDVFPVEVRALRVSDDDREATLLVIHDITERRRAEAALRESEARHSAMISNISDVIGIMGVDGFMKYKSPNIKKWFGWDPEDLIGTDGWLTVHPDDVAWLQKAFFELVQEPGAATTVEYRYLCKDGSYRWIELTATNMIADPIINGVLLNYHDISERKEMERLDKELTSIIDVIGTLSELRDPYTAGHQRRVSQLATLIASDMGFSATDVEDIRIAALLHDIGKISVPVEILSMPRRLNEQEYDLVKRHAQAGYEIIASAAMPATIADLVRQHHERCDGSGYPRGLTASEITPGAKILMVADVVEAMMSHRPYRPALGVRAALAEIESGTGTLYDVEVAAACLRVVGAEEFAFLDV